MKFSIVYNKKLLCFEDTLHKLTTKLSQLPSMFGISNIKRFSLISIALLND